MGAPIYATAKEFERAPAGNHIAICFEIIDIGTVMEMFKGKPKLNHKVRISWELCNEKKKVQEGAKDVPVIFSEEFNLSIGKTSNLGKLLTSWRGKAFTDEEAKKFDITKVIGVPCYLNIIHQPSASDATKVYARIASISPVPKGVAVPAMVYQPSVLSYNDWKEDIFATLPQFVQDKMMKSAEWDEMNKKRLGITNNVDKSEIAMGLTEPFDGLPF